MTQTNPCRANKIKNKPAHKERLPDNEETSMQKKTDTKDACFRQRVLQFAERIHGGGEWNVSAGTTTPAPTERRRESDTDLQEPFHCRNGVNTQIFPPPFVVPSIAPSHCHTEPPAAIQNKSHPLRTCTTPWPVWFQCNSFCTTGNKGSRSSQANNQKKLGTKGSRSLLLVQHIHSRNKSSNTAGHSWVSPAQL